MIAELKKIIFHFYVFHLNLFEICALGIILLYIILWQQVHIFGHTSQHSRVELLCGV